MPRALVYPKGLAVRGKRMWKAVLEVRPKLGPGEYVLLEEACRMTDRLEALSAQINGDAFLTLETKDGETFTVVVDAALQEARLTTVALRSVLMSLGLDRMVVSEGPVKDPAKTKDDKPAADDKPGPERKGDPVDLLAARRAEREAGLRKSGTEGPSAP